MKIVVRAPVKPVWHHAHTQVGDASVATSVALDNDLVLQPFERTVVKAQLITDELEPLIFQNVMLNAAIADTSLQNLVFLEDRVATASEAGHVFVSVLNLTSNPQRIRRGTVLGNVIPVSLVYRAIPQQSTPKPTQRTQVDNDQFAFVNKIYEKMNYDTDSQLTSSSEFEFLSSTDPTEEGLSEREVRKRTDPELMAPVQGPESQLKEVQNLWGPKASASSENILTEFDNLFTKHKADIGRCTIAKHPVELESGAVPHREGARRMSPERQNVLIRRYVICSHWA